MASDNLTDRELLLSVHQTVQAMDAKLKEQNGRLAGVEGVARAQAIQIAQVAGAISFGRWLFGAMLAIMIVGASLAGIVLAVVSQGGN